MLKRVAAVLLCLGIVTLGVAMSRGQDEDLIVIDGKVGATEVIVEDIERVEGTVERLPQNSTPAGREVV